MQRDKVHEGVGLKVTALLDSCTEQHNQVAGYATTPKGLREVNKEPGSAATPMCIECSEQVDCHYNLFTTTN